MVALGDLVIRIGAQTKGAEAGFARTRGAMHAHTAAATKASGATMGLNASMVATAGATRGLSGAFMSAAAGAHGMTAAFLPLMAIGGFVALLRSGSEFNAKMRESLAIVRDVSPAIRAEMKNMAISVAASMNMAASETAKAFFYLESAGLSAAQSIKVLPQAARFARAGMFDLERATELAASSVAAMGLKGRNADEYLTNFTRVTDVLVKANTLAQSTTEEFAIALRTDAANAARIAGQSLEETVAALAALAEKGVKGEKAGSDYARALFYLSIQAVENKEAFEKAGVAMFDAEDKTRSFADVISDIEKRFAGLTDAERIQEMMLLGFTKRTVNLMNTMLGTSEAIKQFTEILEKEAAGEAAKVAEAQMSTLTKGWGALKAAAVDAGSGLMNVLGPALGIVSALLADLLGLLKAAGTSFGVIVDTLAKWATLDFDTSDIPLAATKIAAATGKARIAQLESSLAFARSGGDEENIEFLEGQLAMAKAHQDTLNDRIREMEESQTGGIGRLPERLQRMEDARKAAGAGGAAEESLADVAARQRAEALAEAAQALEEVRHPMSAMQKDLQAFLTPLEEAGLSTEELTQHTEAFTAAWDEANATIEKVPNALDDVRLRAKDAIEEMKRDVELFGLEGRNRMIEEFAGSLSFEDIDILAGMRDWDHKLDELEEKTKASDLAESLQAKLETPMQAAERQMQELLDTARRFPDELAPELAAEGIRRIAMEAGKETVPEVGRLGALVKGTREEYAARMGAGQEADRQKKLVEVNQQMKGLQTRMLSELEALNRKSEAPVELPAS